MGTHAADDKVFNNINPNGSGQIVVQFIQGAADNPKVSALQIIPMPATPTPTFTPTATDTPCMVNGTPCTSTATPTFTATPSNSLTLVLYPNPVKDNGSVLLHVDLSQTTDVRVRVYSIAFRKLREDTFAQVAAGTHDLPVPIQNKLASTLANGLYYVMVDAGGNIRPSNG